MLPEIRQAIVGAAANSNPLPDYGMRISLAEQYFSLAELVNDLLRFIGFLDISPPFSY